MRNTLVVLALVGASSAVATDQPPALVIQASANVVAALAATAPPLAASMVALPLAATLQGVQL